MGKISSLTFSVMTVNHTVIMHGLTIYSTNEMSTIQIVPRLVRYGAASHGSRRCATGLVGHAARDAIAFPPALQSLPAQSAHVTLP